jgi:hypothetical protein
MIRVKKKPNVENCCSNIEFLKKLEANNKTLSEI